MAINLPTQPTGDQYEDLVAACLKALGYFTETRLVLREGGTEVLELDVVATPVGQRPDAKRLFEAKKEPARFRNIFKLYGQRMFLEIGEACLATPVALDAASAQVHAGKGARMGVRVCHFHLESSTTVLAPAFNELTVILRDRIVAAAWYHQIARRIACSEFISDCKTRAPTSELHGLARRYEMRVQETFFQETPLARAEALYDAYRASPRLPGDLVSAIAQSRSVDPQGIWNLVNDTDQLLAVQYLMFAENVARIAVLKNALDDVVQRGATPLPTARVRIGGVDVAWPLHNLPTRFVAGLELLRTHPYGLRLPYLYQCFVELLGGFIAYTNQSELQLIEQITGVPRNEILPALTLLDHFFAPEGGTCFYKQGGEILVLKMVPGFVRGGGCFLRNMVFELHNYDDYCSKMGFLLSKWHNALYAVLEPVLKGNARAKE